MYRKAFLLFEQSGVFKNAFKSNGISAFDYDIDNQFGQTDVQIDLFNEIESAFDGKPSLFDEVSSDDISFAFFPCTYFCAPSQLAHRFAYHNYRNLSFREKCEKIICRNNNRAHNFNLLVKLFWIADSKKLSLIIENPWNNDAFLKSTNALLPPSYIDYDRSLHGDYFMKPTAYWFVNFSLKKPMSIIGSLYRKKITHTGQWSSGGDRLRKMERSQISQAYADNFVSNIVLGLEYKNA